MNLDELSPEAEQVLSTLVNLHGVRDEAERGLQWLDVPLSANDNDADWIKWAQQAEPDFGEGLRAVGLLSRYRHAARAIEAIRNCRFLDALAETSIVAADTTPRRPKSKTGPPRKISRDVRSVLINFDRYLSKQQPELTKIDRARRVRQAAAVRMGLEVSLSTIQRALGHKR